MFILKLALMKNSLIFVSLLFVFAACKKDEPAVVVDPNSVSFDIVLLGKNEVPETISLAEGIFKGTYNKSTKILSYTLTHKGMTATAAHFHKGAANATGAIVINIATAAFVSPLSSQTVALNTQQELDLLAGMWYVNVHSAIYTGGEIRGQLLKK